MGGIAGGGLVPALSSTGRNGTHHRKVVEGKGKGVSPATCILVYNGANVFCLFSVVFTPSYPSHHDSVLIPTCHLSTLN